MLNYLDRFACCVFVYPWPTCSSIFHKACIVDSAIFSVNNMSTVSFSILIRPGQPQLSISVSSFRCAVLFTVPVIKSSNHLPIRPSGGLHTMLPASCKVCNRANPTVFEPSNFLAMKLPVFDMLELVFDALW